MWVSPPQGLSSQPCFPPHMVPTGVDALLEVGDPPPQGPASLDTPAPPETTEEGADTERCRGRAQAGRGRVRVGSRVATCTCLSPAEPSPLCPAPPSSPPLPSSSALSFPISPFIPSSSLSPSLLPLLPFSLNFFLLSPCPLLLSFPPPSSSPTSLPLGSSWPLSLCPTTTPSSFRPPTRPTHS